MKGLMRCDMVMPRNHGRFPKKGKGWLKLPQPVVYGFHEKKTGEAQRRLSAGSHLADFRTYGAKHAPQKGKA